MDLNFTKIYISHYKTNFKDSISLQDPFYLIEKHSNSYLSHLGFYTNKFLKIYCSIISGNLNIREIQS
jgi:hypothetical protein